MPAAAMPQLAAFQVRLAVESARTGRSRGPIAALQRVRPAAVMRVAAAVLCCGASSAAAAGRALSTGAGEARGRTVPVCMGQAHTYIT